MVSDVHLQYVDSVLLKVQTDPGILMELSEEFTYFAPGYKFSPKFRNRVWDGKIRLLNTMTGVCYAGLAKRIKKFCDSRGYTLSFDHELAYDNISVKEVEDFITTLKIPLEIRDYQVDSVVKCLRTRRRTLESPTSSGKSLMIYIITQWYKQHKALIIVPTIGLVKQMEGDFRSYGYQGRIHVSTDGLSKDQDIPCDVTITTWQSLNNGKTKMPKTWYNQFGVVIGDEAHGAKATSLIQILSSLSNCQYRFGTTGTLDGEPLNETTIEGLFGPKYKAVTTKQLMEEGHVSKLKIKCIVLKYPEEVCKIIHGKDKTYNDEVDAIVNLPQRNAFIKNLTLSLKGNKLLFFRMIDHGRILHSLIVDSGANCYYIDGSVSGDNRESIRHAIEDQENAIIIASLGTTSTGVSINKLHHMIAASPSKSKIKVLQSIGRMLRLHEQKDVAILYDIVDDMTYKSKANFTLNHFIERTKIYDQEQFDYEIYNVKIKI